MLMPGRGTCAVGASLPPDICTPGFLLQLSIVAVPRECHCCGRRRRRGYVGVALGGPGLEVDGVEGAGAGEARAAGGWETAHSPAAVGASTR